MSLKANKLFQAGQLDTPITIEYRNVFRNSVGSEKYTYSTLIQTFAEKTLLAKAGFGGIRGKSYQSDQKMQRYDAAFRIRYQEGINVNQRVLCEGNYYDIHLIVEEGRKERLVLYTLHTDNLANVNQ